MLNIGLVCGADWRISKWKNRKIRQCVRFARVHSVQIPVHCEHGYSGFASRCCCDTLRAVDASVETLIQLALTEDIGAGDVTSLYFVPEKKQSRAFVVAREEGVISGVDVAVCVLQKVDDSLSVTVLLGDGTRVSRGAVVMEISGNARSILTAERTLLNFLQRLSGVASLTRKYVEAVAHTNARILDTRKTTPGWRWLEKRAVVHGGGTNHRMGLYDRAMVKDNHLMAEGRAEALQEAIRRLKTDHPGVEVELEADNLAQVTEFLRWEGVDHILLDNMTLEDMKNAVALRGERRKPLLEASGGVNLDTVRAIAETGVDFISVGALTHSAKSMDLAMDFAEEPA